MMLDRRISDEHKLNSSNNKCNSSTYFSSSSSNVSNNSDKMRTIKPQRSNGLDHSTILPVRLQHHLQGVSNSSSNNNP